MSIIKVKKIVYLNFPFGGHLSRPLAYRLTGLLFLLFLANISFAKNAKVDSLLSALKTAKQDTNKVKALNSLSEYAGWQIGNYDTASYYANAALKLAQSLGYKKGILSAYGKLGISYLKLSNYPQSLKFQQEALKIAKQLGNKKSIAANLCNTGIIYVNLLDYSKALEYYQKALQIAKEVNNRDYMANDFGNIGTVYNYTSQYTKALKYFKKALKMFTQLEKKNGMAINLGNIGVAYANKSNFPEALKYFKKALNLNKQIGNKNGISRNMNNIGVLELHLNKPILSKKWHTKAILIAKVIGSKDLIRNSYQGLSQADSALGNYKSAYQNYKMYIIYRDSLKNKANTKKITQLQMQFKFDQQQAADSIAHAKEKEIQQAQIAKQNAVIKAKQEQQYAMFGGLLLVLVFAGFMYNRFKKTQKQKKIIEIQKAETERQKQLVETKNKEISDSITYAKRIQEAILPSRFSLSESLKNGFVFFKPKDIVSGDFYWLETAPQGGAIYFAAADCTGHGVPGAMVSVVCANALSKALLEENITETGKLLDRTREIVIQQFSHSDENVKDGMDISLCKLTPSESGGGLLQWSGANNPLWIIRQNVIASPINREKQSQSNYEFTEIKGNKQPIGKTDNPKPFTTHNIELQKGDSIYIFSDGFADQFGGEEGKKFKYKPLKELLLSLQEKTMDEQKEAIGKAFEQWKGNEEQVDDVCIIGVSV